MASYPTKDEDEVCISEESSEHGSPEPSSGFMPPIATRNRPRISTCETAHVEAVTVFELFDWSCEEGSETESDSSDEQMRWLILAGFCCCIPWGIGMYLGLFTERKKDRGLRLLGKLAALLWAIAWVVFIGLCILVVITIMKVTHGLSEKTYGTVAFMGLMPARTWSDADLLEHVYNLGFDAISISPPGIGDTTNITAQKGGFYTDENFLSQVLESCLDIRLNTTVFVSHSNIVTRQFFFPLLMHQPLFGFVLFDTYTGDEWITEVNPMMNDHEFYMPKTRNYRYVGTRRLSENAGNPGEFIHNHVSSFPVMPRVLQATQCIASPTDDTDQNWDNDEPDLLGPFQFFKGKYKVPGWGTKEQALLTHPLDPPPSDKKSLLSLISSGKLAEEADSTRAADEERAARIREIPVEYFDELKVALSEFLNEIKDRVDIDDYHPDRLPVVLREDRKKEYIRAREKTTIISKSNIYCLSSEASKFPSGSSPQRSFQSSERKAMAHSGTYGTAEKVLRPSRPLPQFGPNETEADEEELLLLSPRLRGTDAHERVPTILRKLPWEHLGPPAPAVHPERFSAPQKRKLKKYYAKLDRNRAKQAASRQKTSAEKLEGLKNRT
ncbi:hypothetical protein NCLIV_055600 [Neospora caninum Liverpool]|uniref:Uncharacterized protein n=1 Tax=Neospora caninum (strain Liverpool) TaxID=572307 RepID=F0VN39_NEOCL|nr:hypothetical protein NCLIV_055600 [Neospora caninum Liverpool]CBZ55135.1 hypothetical protein NCLIV_055600 [Neospora caninum Liverpool]CEL69861.1 TPA: hypothetical protein BN1204_055600 [Neospora caninum Liverpool]|eukprot:XP_003885163.1 hypothetical protein NCLIV_055600 [Neospora caninum Liverpool]